LSITSKTLIIAINAPIYIKESNNDIN